MLLNPSSDYSSSILESSGMKVLITNNFSKNEKWQAKNILKESDQEIESSSNESRKYKSNDNPYQEEQKHNEFQVEERKNNNS